MPLRCGSFRSDENLVEKNIDGVVMRINGGVSENCGGSKAGNYWV